MSKGLKTVWFNLFQIILSQENISTELNPEFLANFAEDDNNIDFLLMKK